MISYIIIFPKLTYTEKIEFWTWITLPLSHSYVNVTILLYSNGPGL